MGSLFCWLGWHKFRPTTYATWRERGINFICTRCCAESKEWPPIIERSRGDKNGNG